MASKFTYPLPRVLLGGLAFGAYYAEMIRYFDPFSFRHDSEIGFWWPIHTILIVVSVGLAFFLFRQQAVRQKGLREVVRLIILGLVAATLGVFVYVGSFSQGPGFGFELLEDIVVHLLLVGLLPGVGVLLLFMGPTSSNPLPVGGEEDAAVVEATAPRLLQLPGISDEAMPDIEPALLMLVEAADNYCKFHLQEEGQRRVHTLRVTLKEVEQSLAAESGFYRCHRSFLVNAGWVEAVEGNSQAYRLRLRGQEELVPVSRSFDLSPIRDRLEKQG